MTGETARGKVAPVTMQQILPLEVLTPAEVADLLKLSQNTVYLRLQDGTIPAIKVGGAWRIPLERFREWLAGP